MNEVIAGYHQTKLTNCGVCGGNHIAFEKDSNNHLIARCWCGATSDGGTCTQEDIDMIKAQLPDD